MTGFSDCAYLVFQPASPRGLDCQNMHIYAYSDYYIHIRQSVCPMNSYQRACEA